MFTLPRTVKFKCPHQVMFRRLHGVLSADLVTTECGLTFYELHKANGVVAVVPYTGTVIVFGRKVTVNI